MRGKLLCAVLVLLLVVLGPSLLVGAWTHYATGCPHAEQECELVGWDCVEWGPEPLCIYAFVAACAAACYPAGFWWGIPCAVGCYVIVDMVDPCPDEVCEAYECNWVCHCPGGDLPEFAIPPVAWVLEDPPTAI
jgi:hypothetical protein